MEHAPLHVEVVSADRVVWSGDAVNIIARTVEGDIGILPGHEPLLAVLEPSMVEIVTAEGASESLMVDGGFISVAHGHVSVLAQFATLGHEVSLEEARKELAPLVLKAQQGQADDAEIHRLKMLKAQVRAGERAASN
ncbi:F0F1 ATP synthase subunit epsilon [Tessaracoccus sp. MC1865]|uniref:F0F1 ATP synthase subunit epsilon n=1 Tax=unclassified Tessaracoccus TaxID=2635419 RepID=UPI00096FC7A6|nr:MULTISPECIES: F0F1 ATP synthase subunit epsilon [unclassified Tessaracoccus]MBB1483450.1 F0F1 ATP synthase subunit epsilon [Tessaracoccus sp. MC1865]MCG6566323.1 F0F1 ATP synthase subunit epsilon [Tessaracoccus sp. ZS01]OMG58795.1 ATP synthase F1 subunit epsilon [Tessaracoccus sp. ZS01]QTO36550.1 F0F1 ATP synthase subunit epsilon [Tessaracoccus sp. MC1865]